MRFFKFTGMLLLVSMAALLIACGGAGTSATVAPPLPPAAAPTTTISANPASIQEGQSTTLTWTTTNATEVSIDLAGIVQPNGSLVMTPAATTTYHLFAKGPGGTQEATTTVTVTPKPPDPPTATLTANPTTIQVGESTTLTWATTNSTDVSIDGQGAVQPNGSMQVTPAATTTYHLVANGLGGTAQASASVTVTPLPPKKVVFIADSMAASGIWAGDAGLKANFPDYNPINKAVPGNTTTQMLARFQTDVIDLHPDIVLIWGSANGIHTMTNEQMEADWVSMIDQAQAANIKVVICTLAPHGPPHPLTENVPIRAMNDWMRSYTSSRGIVLADFYNTLTGPDGLTLPQYDRDGIHLTDAGLAALVPVATQALDTAAKQ